MFKSNGQRKWKLAGSKHVKAAVFGKLLSSSDGGRFEVAILSKERWDQILGYMLSTQLTSFKP